MKWQEQGMQRQKQNRANKCWMMNGVPLAVCLLTQAPEEEDMQFLELSAGHTAVAEVEFSSEQPYVRDRRRLAEDDGSRRMDGSAEEWRTLIDDEPRVQDDDHELNNGFVRRTSLHIQPFVLK